MNYLAFAVVGFLAAAAFGAFLAGAAFGAAALVALGAPFSWIANLGVVPLFLSAAFLLAPAALLWALRRFSVTAVLEAINISSSKTHDLSNLKLLNLTISLVFVKVFLYLPCALSAETSPSDLILAKGEQKELSFPGIKNFSVGNPDVISYKFLQKSQKILIKGKKVGFTDLIVWSKGKKEVLSLYVLSKQKFLKTFQLADALKNLNLAIDIKGPIMTASGTLTEFSDYLYLQKIKGQFQEQVYFKINLDPGLRNHIVGQIYKKLFANGFNSVICQADWLEVTCFYEGTENQNLLKQLASFYRVSFIQQDSRLRHKNYQLKLKLVQLEKMDGREIHMGLDKLKTSVKDLFEFGIRKLVDDNMVFLIRSSLRHCTELHTCSSPCRR